MYEYPILEIWKQIGCQSDLRGDGSCFISCSVKITWDHLVGVGGGDFSGGSDGKEFACSAGDLGLIHGSGRSLGEGNGKPFWYSCLENPMERGPWGPTVHGVRKSQTWLSDKHFHFCFIIFYKDNSLFKCFFVILSNRFYLYNTPSGYLILNKCQCSFYFYGTNKHIKQFLRAFYVLSLCQVLWYTELNSSDLKRIYLRAMEIKMYVHR